MYLSFSILFTKEIYSQYISCVLFLIIIAKNEGNNMGEDMDCDYKINDYQNVYEKCQVNFISFQDIESIMEMFIRFTNIEDDLQTLRKVHTKSEKLMNI